MPCAPYTRFVDAFERRSASPRRRSPAPGFLASLTSVLLLLTASSGCVPAVSNDYLRDTNRDVPDDFGAALAASAESSAAAQQWQDFFDEPDLAMLIESALENNQELNIRVQEILIAQYEILARTGEYLPMVGATAGVGVEKVGETTSQGVSDEVNGVPEHLKDFRFGFTASWEVDIWRKLRNAAKSATFRYFATVEGRNFIVTQLVAEIASSYYELMAYDRQLDVLKRNIELQQNALELVRFEKQAARETELAVQRFEAEVLKNQSRQYDFEQRIIATENRINFLVGRFPQPIARDSDRFDLPLPEVVRSGVPAQLLDNRPDVKQAELQLAASELDVEVAKARFRPSLSIEAGLGYESYELDHLVDTPESLFYGLGAGLMAPLLNRRGIKAEYFAANAEQVKAMVGYEQTVLRAFVEVATQLAQIENLQKRYELEARQVEVLAQAIDVSNVLFQSARADYVEVLLTRRDSLDAQMELIETRLNQKHAIVHVYQALGGGWR